MSFQSRALRFLRTLSLLALGASAVSCSNYAFRDGDGRPDSLPRLIEDLQAKEEDRPYLQEAFWIPLIYLRIRRFHRTDATLEPHMPPGGVTYLEQRGVGPLALFWTTEEVAHYDQDLEEFHRRRRWGVGQRLLGLDRHDVRTPEGRYSYSRSEALFGLLQNDTEGYPRRLLIFPEGRLEDARPQ